MPLRRSGPTSYSISVCAIYHEIVEDCCEDALPQSCEWWKKCGTAGRQNGRGKSGKLRLDLNISSWSKSAWKVMISSSFLLGFEDLPTTWPSTLKCTSMGSQLQVLWNTPHWVGRFCRHPSGPSPCGCGSLSHFSTSPFQRSTQQNRSMLSLLWKWREYFSVLMESDIFPTLWRVVWIL